MEKRDRSILEFELNNMTKKQMKFYVYKTNGDCLGLHTLDSFSTLIEGNVSTQSARTALLGDKGYGYYKGYFISYLPKGIMTKEESIKFSEKILTSNLKVYLRNVKYKFGWNDLVYSATIEYVINAIRSDRGVNNVEDTFSFKYNMNVRDYYRSEKRRNRIYKREEEPLDSLYINDEKIADNVLDSIAATYDDYSYTEDVNVDVMYNAVIEAITEEYDEEAALIWSEYQMNFKSVITKEFGGGISGVARKIGIKRTRAERIFKIVDKWVNANKEEIAESFQHSLYLDDENYPILSLLQ